MAAVYDLHPEPSAVLLSGIDAAGEGIDRARHAPADSLSTEELAAAITALSQLEAQVVALRLSLSNEADVRRAADEAADTGTDSWLAKLIGDTREAARGGLYLAEMLKEKYHHTREAFAAGLITKKQASVIVRAGEQCPSWVTAEQLAEAEAALVAKATGDGTRTGRPMNPTRLRKAARRMLETISRQTADADEDRRLGEEEKSAEFNSWFTMGDLGNGRWRGKFEIPERHALLLRAFLEQLSSPRRLGRDRAGQTVTDQTVPPPQLSWSEKLGSAFLELLEHLPTSFEGGNAFSLMVHIDLEALTGQLQAAGRVDTGAAISAAEARHLACEAGILPAVLNGSSVPLDLGRSRRLYTRSQRNALSILHDSCAVAGCERPFAWTEIHHREPWSADGPTDLDNAVPLCGYHHRRAHDGRWDLRRHGSHEYRFHRRT